MDICEMGDPLACNTVDLFAASVFVPYTIADLSFTGEWNCQNV